MDLQKIEVRMLELVYFILCSYGMTQILLYGDIFNSIRPSKNFLGGFGKLFHCPMCMGFWTGVFLLGINQHSELFTYDHTFVNFLLLGSLSSGTSYVLCTAFGDEGIKHEYTKR